MDSVKATSLPDRSRVRGSMGNLWAATARVVPWLGLTVSAGFTALFVHATVSRSGLFGFAGLDFGMFWAATRAFLARGPLAAYQAAALAQFSAPLAHFVRPGPQSLTVGQAPFPPLFFMVFTPLGVLPPAVAFAIWSAVAISLAIVEVRRLARRVLDRPLWLVPTLVVFFPLAFSLFLGQISVLLLWALIEAYVALEGGQDLQAGLLLSVLLLKPQYTWVLVVVLASKRRWRTLAGMASGGAVLAFSSIAILGVSGVKSFIHMVLSNYTGFEQVQATVYPTQMISWRGLLLNLLPHAPDRVGQALTIVVSLVTVGVIVVVWRGPWTPGTRRFDLAMLATVSAMLLCGYHSHLQDGALLLVPGVAVAASWASNRAVTSALYLGTLVFPVAYVMGSVRETCIVTGVVLAVIVATTCAWTVATRSSSLADDRLDVPGSFGPPAIHPVSH